jgi:NADH-quinone oxidoreductase subunit B
MQGLVMLTEMIGNEKRPLSWTIGPQGVYQPEQTSQKDLKKNDRLNMKQITPPDQIKGS